jgi:hypothetical protein
MIVSSSGEELCGVGGATVLGRLSDEDVAVLLDKFVVADKSGWRERRLDDHKQWKSWGDPAKLGSIPDQDLKSHFLEYFNRNAGRYSFTPSTATESFGMLKGIGELGLLYVVGIQSSVSVWKPGPPLPKGKWKGIGRSTQTLRRRDRRRSPCASWR